MSSEGPGFIIAHNSSDRFSVRPGDRVRAYELAEEWPFASLQPHLEGPGTHDDLDQYVASVLSEPYEATHWKVLEELYCDCRSRRSIGQVQMHVPTARRWLMFRSERLPSALRAPARDEGAEAYPMHERSGEAPHVHGVTTCKGCRRPWLLVAFATSASAVRLRTSLHSASIRE